MKHDYSDAIKVVAICAVIGIACAITKDSSCLWGLLFLMLV